MSSFKEIWTESKNDCLGIEDVNKIQPVVRYYNGQWEIESGIYSEPESFCEIPLDGFQEYFYESFEDDYQENFESEYMKTLKEWGEWVE